MLKPRVPTRTAFTLIELLAVVVLMGVVTLAAFSSMRTGTLGNFGGSAAARRLGMELRSARHQAIATGDEHYLNLTYSGPSIAGYTIYRAASGGDIAVDAYKEFGPEVTVSVSTGGASTPAFTFEGSAASSYQFTIAGASRSWQVSVVAATGRVVVIEL